MGCYNTKQLKKKFENQSRSRAETALTMEEQLKNEILLLRNCLFEVLDMKEYQKSLVSIQQDICIIKMKKRNEENLEEIIRCYEQNVLTRARQIAAILKDENVFSSETSLVVIKDHQHHHQGHTNNSNNQNRRHMLSNLKSLNTNCNSINDSTIFNTQNYDVYHVLRYCSPLSMEENCNDSHKIQPISVGQEEEEKEIQEFSFE